MKNFPRLLLATTVLLAAVAVGRVDAQHPIAPRPEGPNKLPPFFKVDGLYYLDGNEDDLVKVLELAPEAGWIRVQARGTESWVNVATLATVTPISKEAASKLQLREQADYILQGANEISDAINAYAAANNLGPDATFTWKDVRKLLKPDASVYNSDGKDILGRPYVFGKKVADGVKISTETIKDLALVVDNADAYWGKFKP